MLTLTLSQQLQTMLTLRFGKELCFLNLFRVRTFRQNRVSIMKSNPHIILAELNRHLSSPVEITIFGASAINLGYPGGMCDQTRDVDVLIPAKDIPKIEANLDFWEAQQRLNAALAQKDLYLTHVFEDSQVILSPDWAEKRVAIGLPEYDKLQILRPGTPDLILTKMMRNDAEDKAHIQFLLSQHPMSAGGLQSLFDEARVPAIDEIRALFQAMQPWVIELAKRMSAS